MDCGWRNGKTVFHMFANNTLPRPPTYDTQVTQQSGIKINSQMRFCIYATKNKRYGDMGKDKTGILHFAIHQLADK